MCDCMKKMEQRFIDEMGFEEAEAPVELLSGRVYLSFTVRRKDKANTKQMYVMLSKCPICGQEYKKAETPGAATPRDSM